MQVVFEVFKGVFFICTVVIGLIKVVGYTVFDETIYPIVMMIMLPGYLLLLGLMIGYILSNIQAAKYMRYPEFLDNIYRRGLVMGIVLGVLFAGIYLGLYYTGNITIS